MLYPNRLKSRPIVSSGYGWRIHPITGVRTFHYGVDSYGHPNGWNGAPEAGVVTFAGYNGGLGLMVEIVGRTRRWRLGHHARIDVAVGQAVGEGTVTGLTGTTGASTGIHCHTECWSGSSSEDAFAYIAANLGGTAGAGGGGSTPIRKKNSMTTLYWDGQNPDGGNAQWALGGDSPGTTANWITTKNKELAAKWAAVHGAAVDCGSAANFAEFGKWYMQPVKIAASNGAAIAGGALGSGSGGTPADPSGVIAAVQALGDRLAPKLDAVVAATNKLNPPG